MSRSILVERGDYRISDMKILPVVTEPGSEISYSLRIAKVRRDEYCRLTAWNDKSYNACTSECMSFRTNLRSYEQIWRNLLTP
ncbi:MAG: hypothetical protein JSV24_01985 [Bacteroidales bacterium]|nr:MAG: hypothetical protein JSV24_01985 [Bacteroidales bacterium]